MSQYPQIESYPDEYWMNCVQDSLRGSQNCGILVQIGVNPHWPSQQGRAGSTQFFVWRVWGEMQEAIGPFYNKKEAERLARDFRELRKWACPDLNSLTHYVCISEQQERISPVSAKEPYVLSFDPMI